jgi:hypothetical protein
MPLVRHTARNVQPAGPQVKRQSCADCGPLQCGCGGALIQIVGNHPIQFRCVVCSVTVGLAEVIRAVRKA